MDTKLIIDEEKMTESIDDFQKMLVITDIDEDLIQQPTIYSRISHAYAVAIDIRDAKKQEADKVFAELIVWGKQVENKTTELLLKSQAEMNPKYQEACKDYRAAKYAATRWEGLLEAFEQRRSALLRLSDQRDREYMMSNSSRPVHRESVYRHQRSQLNK